MWMDFLPRRSRWMRCADGRGYRHRRVSRSGNSRKPTSVVDVIGLSFAILQRHAVLEWRRAADIIIEPIVKDFLWDDFEKTSELIAAGKPPRGPPCRRFGQRLRISEMKSFLSLVKPKSAAGSEDSARHYLPVGASHAGRPVPG